MLFAPRSEAAEEEVREFVRLIDRKDLISLAAGLPAPELYPMEELRSLMDEVLAREGRSLLHWGTALGDPRLRRCLADRLPGVSPSEILVLAGSTQGIFLLTRALVEPGNFVAVQSPTYIGALQTFRDAGARVVGIPIGETGIDLEMTESVFARTRPKLLYLVPTFQNPTGTTMSLETRVELLKIAYRHGVPIVEDDPYSLLRYEGEEIPSIKSLDTHGHVLYLSTFSKTLFPGFRIGWLAGPKPVIERLVADKHRLDLFTGSVGQAVAAEFMSRGLLEAHLGRVRKEYRARQDAMERALRRHAPRLRFAPPEGGYFLWAKLPPGTTAKELLREALKKKVSFIHGDIFSPDGRARDRIRITFASHPPETIEEGIRRLAAALRVLRKGKRIDRHEEEASAQPIV
jgi:DNA-binding transcriptional MocR family regulator